MKEEKDPRKLFLLVIGAGIIAGLLGVGAFLGSRYTEPQGDESAADKGENYMELADAAFSEKRYGEAYYYLNKEIGSDPGNQGAKIKLAEILHEKGRDDEAVEILSKIDTRDNGQKIEIKKLLSEIYIRQEKYEKAQKELLDLIAILGDSEEVNRYKYILAEVYLYKGNTEEYESILRDITKAEASANWYYNAVLDLALVHIDDVDSRDALLTIAKEDGSPVKELVSEIELDLQEVEEAEERQDTAQAQGWYGIILLKNSKCAYALDYFEEAIAIADQHAVYDDAHKYYGMCLYELGKYQEAREEIQVALGEDPVDLDAWLYKAYVCDELDDSECETEAYTKIISVNQANPVYLKAYIDYLSERGEVEETLKYLDQLYGVTEGQENKEEVAEKVVDYSLKQLRSLERGEGDVDNKELLLNSLSGYCEKISRDNAEHYLCLGTGNYYRDKSETGEIKNNLEEAIKKDQMNVWAYYYLGLVYIEEQDEAKAIDNLTKAIDYDLKGEVSELASDKLEDLDTVI